MPDFSTYAAATPPLDGTEKLLAHQNGVPVNVAVQMIIDKAAVSGAATLAATEAVRDAASAETAAALIAFDTTSSTYAASQWVERLKTMLSATYVNHNAGDDSRTAGTLAAPVKTIARALALASTAIPAIMLARGQRHPARLADYVNVPPTRSTMDRTRPGR